MKPGHEKNEDEVVAGVPGEIAGSYHWPQKLNKQEAAGSDRELPILLSSSTLP